MPFPAFFNSSNPGFLPNVQPGPQVINGLPQGWINITGTGLYTLEITHTSPRSNDFLIIFTAQHEGNSRGSAEMLRVQMSYGYGQQPSSGTQQNTQQQWQQQQQLGTRISGQGSAVILQTRFNSKTGKVELIKNGVISRIGYLNLIGKNLNRRQALRNYRFR